MKIFLILILSFAAAIGEKSILAFQGSDNDLTKITVWEGGEDYVDGYRIPGMIVTTDGTVLAYAEARPTWGDADPKSIVLRRSKDGGLTWLGNIYIEKSDGNYWKQHVNFIDPRDVAGKKEVWTNPAAIVDRVTGRVFLFYALSEGTVEGQNLQRYTKVFYRYSDDEGLSWSDRVEVTDILNSGVTDEGFPCDALGRTFHMPGPGHGIQLSNGRLLMQVWNRTALGVYGKGSIPVENRKYGLCTLYSDDHGATWKYGSAFGHEVNMNEARMVELENGDIYLNARYVNSDPRKRNNHRVVAISHDKGVSWENISIDRNFPLSSPCDAGLIRLKDHKNNRSFMLYSKNESINGRMNLFLRLSFDEGKNWPWKKLVHEGPASYSDLTVLPDKTVLLLYETGKGGPVYCMRFTQDWLMNEMRRSH